MIRLVGKIWAAIKWSFTPHPELFDEPISYAAASMIAPEDAAVIQAAAMAEEERPAKSTPQQEHPGSSS